MRRVVTGIATVAVLAGCVVGVAAFGRGSQSPVRAQVAPAGSPVPGGTAGGGQLGPQPAPSVYTVPGSVKDKVIHVAYTYYDSTPSSRDPANGQQLNGDLWADVGADGSVLRVHNRLTYADGTLHQDTLLTKSSGVTIFGPAYATQHLGPPNGCIDRTTDSAKDLASYPLPFVSTSALATAKFVSSGAGPLLHAVPTTAPAAGASPSATEAVQTSADDWTFTDGRRTTTFELAKDGRVLGQDTKTNRLNSEGWQSYGALDIYQRQAAPASAFALPQGEVCNG